MTEEAARKPEEEPQAPEKPAHKTDHEQWPAETGGPKGPEPTRYGDWERKGRVSDF
ncbi:MAG: succinate dehydrogenase assembly factor 4 [Pseudomonadota bacterium]